jgi:hypothetical protein
MPPVRKSLNNHWAVGGQFNFKRVAVVERSEPTAGKFQGLGGTRPRPPEIFELN